MGAVALTFLLALAPVEIVSEPAGARVVWTRPDSPVTMPGGVTPCRIEVTGPRVGPYTFIVSREGYHTGYATVDASELVATATRQVVLAPFELADLPALLTDPETALPAPGVGFSDDDYDLGHEVCPSPTGAGAFVYRSLAGLDFETLRDEIWWAPAAGQPRRILAWDHTHVYGHSEPWYARLRYRTGGDSVYSELDVSPDGRWLAFSRTVDGWCAIELLQPESRKRRVIAMLDDAVCDFPVFAPDGSALAFTLHELREPAVWRPGPPGPPQIGLADLRTSQVLTLTGETAAFSPDSQQLALGSDTGVAVYDRASGRQRPVAGLPEVTEVQWSPDGQTLAVRQRFRSDWRDTNVAADWLWLIAVATGRAERFWSVDRRYAWLPDGRSLLVDQRRFDLSGADLGTWSPSPPAEPDWLATPAGSFAVITDPPEPIGAFDGRLVRRDGEQQIPLAGPYPLLRSLSASADGQRVAAVFGGDGEETLLLLDQGEEPRTVRLAEPVYRAVLSPDGGCLAVADRRGRVGVGRLDGGLVWSERRLSFMAKPKWVNDRAYRPYYAAAFGIGRDGRLVEPLALPLEKPWLSLPFWDEPRDEDEDSSDVSFRWLRRGVTP